MTSREAEIQARADAARHWPTMAEIGQERADLAYLLARVATLEAQVTAVRELHRAEVFDGTGWKPHWATVTAVCAECGGVESEYPVPHPCLTITALDSAATS